MIDIFTQVGMGAFFAAVARVPLTSTAIVFEMSGNFGLIPPLMIASVLGSSVGDLLNKGSLYDLLMIWSGIHLYGPKKVEMAESVPVAAVAREDALTLPPTATIKEAESRLGERSVNGCPVVEKGRLLGVIRMSQIELAREQGIADDTTLTKVFTRNPVSVAPR